MRIHRWADMSCKTLKIVLLVFLIANILAFVHAYKFTHFSSTQAQRIDPSKVSAWEKAKILFTGIDNPRPTVSATPSRDYEAVYIKSDVQLEAWHMRVANPKGTVILFHGYCGVKSQLLERADQFLNLGYNTFLVDFIGSGGSEGNETSIGYTEAIEVKDCYEYIRSTGETHIVLFGTSMGAVAILKAAKDHNIKPTAIVLECPFGSLYETVCARFKMMGIPSFPMASMLTFWGGVQHSYWAFGHNSTEYAAFVTSPTLLLFGESDDRVSMDETKAVYENIKGKKKLVTYPDVGHQVFTDENKSQWVRDVSAFLHAHSPN